MSERLSRKEVIERINEYEREGKFFLDVEEDAVGKPLQPQDVKYLDRRIHTEIKRALMYRLAYSYYHKMKKKGVFLLDDVIGAHNLKNCKGGVVITCNHFNAFDSFIMQLVFDKSKRKGRMYRIIKESNYTSFDGFYGKMMRYCDTIPLSSVQSTMKNFLSATDKALKNGNAILIYPEQSMWWNYRKPKPLKSGAFDIATRSNVPVVPVFITMKDAEKIDEEGYKIQRHTAFVGEPIYPDENLPRLEQRKILSEKVFEYNKKVYEDFYKIPLVYETNKYQ